MTDRVVPVTDLRTRETEMTAELVRTRLEELGCTSTLSYTETDVWLEEGGRKYGYHRWREWYRPILETLEDRAGELAAILSAPLFRLPSTE